jgi:hypothetical protein
MGPETDPKKLTLYFDDIDLKNTAKTQRTGVFFPEKYQPSDKLTVLLYLHGHDNPSIDKHWVPKPGQVDGVPNVYLVREQLNDSGKNLVLVAPSLGLKSEAGVLVKTGVNWYLGEVLDRLVKNAPAELKIGDTTAVVDVFVMAHSGGGVPMLDLAQAIPSNGAGNLIRQFWGFDCLYAPAGHHARAYNDNSVLDPFDPEAKWAFWAFSQQGIPFFMHYATDEPSVRALNLKKMADGWRPKAQQRNVPLPPAGVIHSITVTESLVKQHEPMVRPAMKLRLDALP